MEQTIEDTKININYKGNRLSPKQAAVLELLSLGYSNTEIATMLCVSPRTVEAHIFNIRDLIRAIDNTRINDRRLVLLARNMMDAYKHYLRQRKY